MRIEAFEVCAPPIFKIGNEASQWREALHSKQAKIITIVSCPPNDDGQLGSPSQTVKRHFLMTIHDPSKSSKLSTMYTGEETKNPTMHGTDLSARPYRALGFPLLHGAM